MKKLSGILPSNSRLAAVDMSKSQPVRSGTPSFGRSVIEASNTKPLPKTVLNEASWTYDQVMSAKEKDKAHQGIIDHMNDAFFQSKIQDMKESPATTQPVGQPAVNPTTDSTYLVGENLNVVA